MPTKRTIRSATKKSQAEIAGAAGVSFRDLSKKQYLTLQEAVYHLHEALQVALVKGYSYQELAFWLQQKGIPISASTLKKYLSSNKDITQVKALGKTSNTRHQEITTSKETSKKTVEVFIPSKAEISSYVVTRDFWDAYQDSLRERDEVYRRLAKS